MDSKLVGNFIARLRREKGYTQKQLADKLSVTDKAVSRWETGKGYPDIQILVSLGEVLGVSLNELLSGKRLETEEREIQSEKHIVNAYSQAKKAKHRSKLTVILSVVITLLFVLGALGTSFLMVIKSSPMEKEVSEIRSNEVHAVLSEINALIVKEAEPSDEMIITDMSFWGEGEDMHHGLFLLYDPVKEQRYEINFDLTDTERDISINLFQKKPFYDKWEENIERFFGIESDEPEPMEPEGFPYEELFGVMKNLNYQALADEYGGEKFVGFCVRTITKCSLPAEEGTLLERRPKLLYENGSLTELHPENMPPKEYYIICIMGAKNAAADGDDAVYICIEA